MHTGLVSNVTQWINLDQTWHAKFFRVLTKILESEPHQTSDAMKTEVWSVEAILYFHGL